MPISNIESLDTYSNIEIVNSAHIELESVDSPEATLFGTWMITVKKDGQSHSISLDDFTTKFVNTTKQRLEAKDLLWAEKVERSEIKDRLVTLYSKGRERNVNLITRIFIVIRSLFSQTPTPTAQLNSISIPNRTVNYADFFSWGFPFTKSFWEPYCEIPSLYSVCTGVALGAASLLFTKIFLDQTNVRPLIPRSSYNINIAWILIGGVMAPLTEERAFRGQFNNHPRFHQVFSNSLIFGLIHLANLPNLKLENLLPFMAVRVIDCTVGGLFFSGARVLGGNLWAPVFAHATHNIALSILYT